MLPMDASSVRELIVTLAAWRDQDEPLVEAFGDALARWSRLDSQEQARRLVDTLIEVIERELSPS
jgi:hypothetical protein